LNKARIRAYAADAFVMMASACSSRIRALLAVALGTMMMFPDTFKLLFNRLRLGTSRKAGYSDSLAVKSNGEE
jgi:hypothetical protein